MTRSPASQLWNAEGLWEALEPLLPGLSVEVVAKVASTNTSLLDRARGLSEGNGATRPGELSGLSGPRGRRAGDVSPCLMVAELQTRGRGRQGREWLSGVGTSLTFSLSLPLAPANWGGLSLAVGLALADALDPRPVDGTPHIALKWPNDLWLVDAQGAGRKLGGILIETVMVGEHRLCVVGVGLNVLPRAEAGEVGLNHGYACLQELEAQASAPAALARAALPLVRALKQFESQGFAPLRAAYARRDLLRGRAVTTSAPDSLEGVAEGVDANGALLLRCGALHRVVSGEVSVLIRP